MSSNFAPLNALVNLLQDEEYSAIWVLVDENTALHCLPILDTYLKDNTRNIIRIPSGEQFKVIATSELIWEQLLREGADRYAVLINLGGGVIGDMGGFAASTYKRGINFIHIPTTLLSMVDASIGGKTGVDLAFAKNAIGTFTSPAAVFLHSDFLKTLPWRHLMSGVAEMLKHGLLYSEDTVDELFGIDLKDTVLLQAMIEQSVEIKAAITEQDPYEMGLRKCLNFGHTIGHAIESWSLAQHENPMLHGEAVAFGIVAELQISHQLLGFPKQMLTACEDFIKKNFQFEKPDEAGILQIMENLSFDKKNQKGQIRFALLEDIGKAKWDVLVEEKMIRQSIEYSIACLCS